MPVLDMPIDALKTYKGINPKPDDFEEFWKRALDEVRGLGTAYELEPSDFQAPFASCFHLYFRGVGGARIHAKLLKPKTVTDPHPAVVQFHGYRCSSGDWYEKLCFVGAGYSFAAMDCRGQGGLSEDCGGVKGNTDNGHIIRGLSDSPDRLLYRQIFLDTVQLVRIIMSMEDTDEKRVGVCGYSQGGGLSLACAALEPGIKKAAAAYPFLCDYRRVWEMDLVEKAYAELRTYFRLYDPLHGREEKVFERLGYIDVQHLAPRIKADVLMATGLMDDCCPPSTQFAAYNKIQAKKEVAVYPDLGHENLPGFPDRIFQFMMGL
ncbi:MAG: acetylxylan esterase [Spirochaetales bacterium]|nr:acetylxylan esterase [Spirochaetales bacterium]